MIPHAWKAQTRKLPAHERADYLVRIIEGVEQALDENDMQRLGMFRNELNLYPARAALAMLLYDRRGQIVAHERLIFALKCRPDTDAGSVLVNAIYYVRKAIKPYGGKIKAFHLTGYKMTCPDIPQLERKDP